MLRYVKNWDKLLHSLFESDVYVFSPRQQIDRRWGTTQPLTIRDKDFGAVRLPRWLLRPLPRCAPTKSWPRLKSWRT